MPSVLWPVRFLLNCLSNIQKENSGTERSRDRRRIATRGKSNHSVSGPSTDSPLRIAISAEQWLLYSQHSTSTPPSSYRHSVPRKMSEVLLIFSTASTSSYRGQHLQPNLPKYNPTTQRRAIKDCRTRKNSEMQNTKIRKMFTALLTALQSWFVWSNFWPWISRAQSGFLIRPKIWQKTLSWQKEFELLLVGFQEIKG